MKLSVFVGGCFLFISLCLGFGCSTSTVSNSNQSNKVNATRSGNPSPDVSDNSKTEKDVPEAKEIKNPGDPNLTYEMVEKNVKAYIGKRVRWECFMLGSIGEDGKNGCTNLGSGMFLVQYEGKGGVGETWAHGTIKGLDSIVVLGASGKKTTIKIPMLVDLEFEPKKP